MNTYDSTADTLKHIKEVNSLLIKCAMELLRRAAIHDDSKLQDPEKPIFDEVTPLLKDLAYGSDEYKEMLKRIKPALDHHYANNSHHPEYYKTALVDGMNLFDLIEMLMDWKAATQRTKGGDIFKSLEINRERFFIEEQLGKILFNTISFPI